MHGLYTLLYTLVLGSLGDSRRRGVIINFEPPELNDWVDELVVKETDVRCHDKRGKLVTLPKLDLFSMTLERYCVQTRDLPPASQAQWYHPQKVKCGEHYNVLKLRYNEVDIDCLRVTVTEKTVALASVRAVVLRRFYLKVYYLTTSGDCFVKYFELPVRRCSRRGHVKLPRDMCEDLFPRLSRFSFLGVSSDDRDDINVKLLS